jgi:Ni,Fe-hydrogenase I large subunit
MNVGPLSRLLNAKVRSNTTDKSVDWKNLFESGIEAQNNKQYDQAELLYGGAYELAVARHGEKNIVISEILMQLATLKEELGKADAAQSIRSRARKIITDYSASQDETKQA